MKIVKVTLILITTIFLAISYLPLKDALVGVPYSLKSEPVALGDNHLTLVMDIGCNRFYAREIGMIIEPPLFMNSVSDIHTAVTGNVNLKIEQDDVSITEVINLSKTGSSSNSHGIWSKLFYRFDPIGHIWCGNQSIQIDVNDLNFSLAEHNITFYVSRDRRP